jgi:hypothetical protein
LLSIVARTASAEESVVFPLPPFGLAIAMTCMAVLLGKQLSSVGQEAAFNVRLESSFPGKSESCFLPTKPLEFLKRNRCGWPLCQQLRRGSAKET